MMAVSAPTLSQTTTQQYGLVNAGIPMTNQVQYVSEAYKKSLLFQEILSTVKEA